MNKNKILIISLIICAIGASLFIKQTFTQNKITKEDSNQEQIHLKKVPENIKTGENKTSETKIKQNTTNTEVSETKSPQPQKEVKNNEREINLYSDVPSTSLPLSAIVLMPDIPENVKNEVSGIYENNNVFMAKKHGDKLILITENNSNIRHGIEFTEISLVSGHKTNTNLGYSGKVKDTENEIWNYDNETNKPLRHTVYDKSGDMIFVETWDYNPENQIKYEMKDNEGRMLSIRKETLENGTDLRVEHLIYDKDGNTKVNVSTTYDGADIKRFTYYNADKPKESGAIFSEYSEGLKTKETLYTSDLKVINTLTSEYNDGNRENITVYDAHNKIIEELSVK